VACIGACGLAPVIKVNDEFFAEMTAAKLDRIMKNYRKEAEANE
jgi:NADH:ubiquinone oxidoreductase subunit E